MELQRAVTEAVTASRCTNRLELVDLDIFFLLLWARDPSQGKKKQKSKTCPLSCSLSSWLFNCFEMGNALFPRTSGGTLPMSDTNSISHASAAAVAACYWPAFLEGRHQCDKYAVASQKPRNSTLDVEMVPEEERSLSMLDKDDRGAYSTACPASDPI